MGEDKRFDMMKTLKERQDKFIYYIAGLNVAAIGFTLSKTFDPEKIGAHYIFLGIALMGWLISTAASFRWILIQFRAMERNLEIQDLNNGYYDKSKITEQDKKKHVSITYANLQEDAVKCDKAMKIMMLLFIVGIVFFIMGSVFDLFQISI